jgi:hypothetical protein
MRNDSKWQLRWSQGTRVPQTTGGLVGGERQNYAGRCDFWAAGGWNFLALNLLLGVAVIPVAIWASRKYGDRLGRSWLTRRVAEEIAGRELRVAMDSLAKISEFDRE